MRGEVQLFFRSFRLEYVSPTGALAYWTNIILITIPTWTTAGTVAESALFCHLSYQYGSQSFAHRTAIIDITISASTDTVAVTKGACLRCEMHKRLYAIIQFHGYFR
jgi:hypothetical protein